ncbi:WDR68 family WD repeat protein [Schizosaccharomyces japonicus yFS275]|uniref:WDR68 family WD repeat protein n=1 Tax=Schizosaccharomyces japonicus (strain yFS275 / FY16936) TaxID=402676 RepID=B6K5W1_SCHJY|nr:WDR68 family WD repeat protein [Schizosaccharomyces japonicus yFS275]EEB08915.1 WDR68 family WD repeat protein [Schizosaccharomyces japonicus yFS275]
MSNLRRNRYSISGNLCRDFQPSSERRTSPSTSQTVSAYGASNLRNACYYKTPYSLYAMDWCKVQGPAQDFIACASFTEETNNKIQVFSLNRSGQGQPFLDKTHSTVNNLDFPCTKLLWNPSRTTPSEHQFLASSDQKLQLWRVANDAHQNDAIEGVASFSNAKTNRAAPLTSFDWCKADISQIVTSSIDTTCTVWDIVTQQSKTQLIAHDKEVFDVQFLANSVDVFASVGADGSVRMFDLRSLDHSTIIYEAEPAYVRPARIYEDYTASAAAPLLRLSACDVDPNLMATFHHKSSNVLIIDIRAPGQSSMTLQAHTGAVNAVHWLPGSRSRLVSCAEDKQVLLWELNKAESSNSYSHHPRYNSFVKESSIISTESKTESGSYSASAPVSGTATPATKVIASPSASWLADTEVNNVCTSGTGDAFAAVHGRTAQVFFRNDYNSIVQT